MSATLALGLAGLGMSAIQSIMGYSQQRQAEKELDKLEVPELDNAYEDMQISTMGSDIMKDNYNMQNASMIDAARSGGVLSVMSSIPKIIAMGNMQNQQMMKSIDDQVMNRDMLIARENTQNKMMKEQRYSNDVQGLGQLAYSGQQNMWNGFRGLGASTMAMLGGIEGGDDVSGAGAAEKFGFTQPVQSYNPSVSTKPSFY